MMQANTGVRFETKDPLLSQLVKQAEEKCRLNIKSFGGDPVLVEGGGYEKIWLETQPMGGAMYASRDFATGLNKGYEYEITAVRDIKRLVIILDERYYYDQNRYLRSKYLDKEGRSDVRNLFHWLNQAKEELSIIVRENTYVYETLLTLLQPDTVR